MPRLTQKGQVTIPLVVRRMLHLKGGDEIFFEIQDGKVSPAIPGAMNSD